MKKNNKKTIAFFNGFYIPHLGGVERYTNKLVEQLKEEYNIIIITTNDSNTISEEIIEDIKVYRLPTYNICKKRYPILKKNKEYKRIMNKIKNEKIDHVICNTRYYQTSLLGAKYAKNNQCDLSIIDHSSNHITVGNKVLDFMGLIYEHYLTHRIKKMNPRFYGVSKKCNEWLKHFKIKASGVFYNSIDDSIYKKYYNEKKKEKGNIVISYIGRIIPEKGIVNLLDAYEEVLKKHSKIKLIIAGDGPILEKLKSKYKNVDFVGKINYEEVMKLCNITDIFVHPSMYPEGLPTSILEAGIMKCAVIATDRGGTREVISSEKIGLIVEENKDDLVVKLDYLLENQDIIKELGNNIHDLIMKKFVWKETAKIVKKEMEKYE